MTDPTTATAALIASRIRRNEYYRRAIESPEYTAAVEMRAEAVRLQHSLPVVRQPDPPTTAAEISTDWLTMVAEADAAARAQEVKLAALKGVIILCDKQIESLVSDTDRALTVLAAELRSLVAEIGEIVARLNGASTPREVIAAGVGDVWRELFPLRESYDALRQAQEWIMGPEVSLNSRGAHHDFAADPHASDAWIRNLDTVFPSWQQPDRTIHLNGVAPDRRPWPSDPIEMLVWLSISGAQVWVPTSRELAALHAERRARRNPAPQKPKSREERSKRARLESRGLLGG